VTEDIFNADASGAAPASHVIVAPASIAWSDAPPSLPPGAKMAVLAGDPSKPGPFVIRAQVPAGYKVPPHWHPTDEKPDHRLGHRGAGHGRLLERVGDADGGSLEVLR
jgi:hypothetical protein